MPTYGELGPTYGAHADRTYGTLFDLDEAPILGLVALRAVVAKHELFVNLDSYAVRAKNTTPTIGYLID